MQHMAGNTDKEDVCNIIISCFGFRGFRGITAQQLKITPVLPPAK
jgi:hypothetical protein